MPESPPKPTQHPAPGPTARAATLPFLAIIYAYRLTLSPFVGGQCRHSPTCSRYALEAYRIHGPIRGTLLTLSRILRCQPFATGGYDPVPLNEPRAKKPPAPGRFRSPAPRPTDPTPMPRPRTEP